MLENQYKMIIICSSKQRTRKRHKLVREGKIIVDDVGTR